MGLQLSIVLRIGNQVVEKIRDCTDLKLILVRFAMDKLCDITVVSATPLQMVSINPWAFVLMTYVTTCLESA